jgi:hypothetical protein
LNKILALKRNYKPNPRWKDNPQTFPLLKSKLESDENWDVRYAAVQEIARGWKDNPDALAFLESIQ